MEIIWSDFAEKQLDEIFEYYRTKTSLRIAKRIIRNLLNEPNKLIENPFIGQIEYLLQHQEILYRYLIYKNYKIIYTVDQEIGFVKIADVFDTRQSRKNKTNAIRNRSPISATSKRLACALD